jgi:hypothetical protein
LGRDRSCGLTFTCEQVSLLFKLRFLNLRPE